MSARPRPPRIACFGAAASDARLTAKRPLERDTSNPVTRRGGFGGVARNVAVTLARLGREVAFAGPLGTDADSIALIDDLRAEGVDTDTICRLDGAHTASFIAVLEPEGDLAFGLADMDILDALTPSDMSDAFARLAAHDAWFMDANLPAPVIEALITARPNGVLLAADAVSTAKAPRLIPWLGELDILFANEQESLTLTLGVPFEDIMESGLKRLITGRGANGVLITDAAGTRARPAPGVEVVNVVGAGDALAAGTLHGLLDGRELDEATNFGLELAALVLASEDTVPSAASIRKLIGRQT